MKKYELVETWIRENIGDNHIVPGEKLPSENQLCNQFGCSRNSVRQAIRNLVRDGWVESIKGIGTFCRTRVSDARLTKNVGFVCFFSGSYIFPEIMRGCDHVLYQRGFHLLLSQSEYDVEKERTILKNLLRKEIDGLLVEPVNMGDSGTNVDLLREFEASGIPVVLIDSQLGLSEFSCVRLDEEAGGRTAAEYLWSRGHRRIGAFYQTDYEVKRARVRGARAFLRERGTDLVENWVIGFRGQGPKSEARASAERCFQNPQDLPTAFICGNDEEALALIDAAEARSIRIPGQLSVVGYDNSNISRIERISLTSVDHPSFLMGEMATNTLLGRIFHPAQSFATQTILRPRLVERSSVCDVP